MWIIASAPFWIIGAGLSIAAIGALIYGLFSKKVDQEEFNKISTVTIMVAIAGGFLMIFAAHLCS